MDFKTYQEKSRKTAIYPDAGSTIIYPTLGLAAEAGEVANKVKKVLRDNNGVVSDEAREQILDELGDVLWYIAQLSTELKTDLSVVAEKNIEKLYSRMDRGLLSGSGDKR